MEPRERAWSIGIVTLAVIAFAVRIQSSPAEEPQQVAVESSVEESTSGDIPVSSGLPYATRDTRFQVFADPQAPLARPYASEMEEPVVQDQVDETPDLVLSDEVHLPEEDEPEVFVHLADDYTIDDPWSLSDQQVVDEMLDILTPEQRADFRSMWASMSSAERRAWVNELRMAFAG